MFSEFTRRTFFVCLGNLIVRNITDFMIANKKRIMGREIHESTLKKIMFAPVNLFFDVTPMGKIIQIFTKDIKVLDGQILEPLKHCMEMLSHVIVVFSILIAIGSWEVFVVLGLMFWIMSGFISPYMHADNQLHKVGATLWDPIHSYFHECMRGTTIIRAYGQEETILKK